LERKIRKMPRKNQERRAGWRKLTTNLHKSEFDIVRQNLEGAVKISEEVRTIEG